MICSRLLLIIIEILHFVGLQLTSNGLLIMIHSVLITRTGQLHYRVSESKSTHRQTLHSQCISIIIWNLRLPHGIYHPKSGIYHLRYMPWFIQNKKMVYIMAYTIDVYHGTYHYYHGIYHGICYDSNGIYHGIYDGIYLAMYHGIYTGIYHLRLMVYTMIYIIV